MHSRWLFPWLLALALCGCLQKVRVEDDAGESVEEFAPSRSCSVQSHCPAAQTCCMAGLLGSCVSLENGASCPLPDLSVSVLAGSLSIEQRTFDRARPRDACALEKQCVGGSGARRLLRFGARTTNSGNADLLLGTPGRTPGFEPAACDGQPYFADYLRYTLSNPSTAAVVAEGHMQALCQLQPTPPSLLSRFDCQFMGLWQGFSEVYAPDVADCQWVDITDVPPGEYLLRLHVNPEAVLDESDHSNNTADLPITLPTGDPLAMCPVPYDGLSGYGTERECGWSFVEAPADAGALPANAFACTPGATIRQGCSACPGFPMLRACDGAGPCPAGAALATAITTFDCAAVSFECPSSGNYSLLVAPYGLGEVASSNDDFWYAPPGCEAAAPSSSAAGEPL